MGQAGRTRSYFDAVAHEYLLEREKQYSFVCQRNLVLDLLPVGCGRVLDIGCGPAVMAEELLKQAYEVFGIDLSPGMIGYGRDRMQSHPAGSRCHLSVGNIERLGFADGYFDAVVAMGVIEYLASYDQALAEIRRVLRPGGVAVLTVPNRVCAYHVTREAAEALRAAAKRLLGRPPSSSSSLLTNRCVPWRLARQLEGAGFDKVQGRFCNFVFYPLHELHEGASLALNRSLSRLSGSRLGVLAGTQYVVKAQKH